MIGSPWKRPKRDRDLIDIAGVHPHAGVPEAGVPELPRLPKNKPEPGNVVANKDTE